MSETDDDAREATMRRARIGASVSAAVLACVAALAACKDDTVYVGGPRGTSAGTLASGGAGGMAAAGDPFGGGGMSSAPVPAPDAGGEPAGHDAARGDDDGGDEPRRDGGTMGNRDAEPVCVDNSDCDWDETCVGGACE